MRQLHNKEAPNYTMRLDSYSSPHNVSNKENSHNRKLSTRRIPTKETPNKDPHKGDLGLLGFPKETASIRNPFGGKVDQLLLFKIPGGIAKI